MAYYYSPFRQAYRKEDSKKGCVFCDEKKMRNHAIRDSAGAVVENVRYAWIVNRFPKFEGHTMLVPKRHMESLLKETSQEVWSRQELLTVALPALYRLYPGSGVEVFAQSGPGSDASVRHIHWHVVPARPSDPLRSFEKLGHFYTAEEGKEKVIFFPHAIRLAGRELQEALAQHVPSKLNPARKQA